MDENKYSTVRNFAKKNRERGTWPDSEASIWAIKQKSSDNGFKDAFINMGRRVLIDEEKFWSALIKFVKTNGKKI